MGEKEGEKQELTTLMSKTQIRDKAKTKLGYNHTTKPILGPLISLGYSHITEKD